MLRLREREHGVISLSTYVAYDDIAFPMTDTITEDTMPEQDYDKLETICHLWYMDEEIHEVEAADFEVMRWDAEWPFRVLLKNDKLNMILVAGPEQVEDDGNEDRIDDIGVHVFNDYVHPYPIQYKELLGIATMDQYPKGSNDVAGMIIRADAGGDHPQYVIYEEDQDGKVRLVTGQESRVLFQIIDTNYETKEPKKTTEGYPWWPTNWRMIYNEENPYL